MPNRCNAEDASMSVKRTFRFTKQGLKVLPIPPKPVTDEDRK